MSRYSVSPELLFDRPWRAGHPFRPHCGRMRRWAIAMLLAVLCLIIGGYDYLTDSTRVREMAQSYLTRLIGGRVEVGAARLSIFEGLRLENVRVHVDEDGDAPDSVIFNAQTIIVLYDPRSMLGGQLEATQIIAEKPRVLLAVNPSDNLWNYHRLTKLRAKRPRPVLPSRMPAAQLPEILLRNARLEMSEVVNGKLVEQGSMALDGQVLPSADGQHFSFELQSRGSEGVGPYVTGTVDTATGGMDANLRNFQFGQDWDFGHDLQKMLPAAVRDWWQRHELAGRLDIPVVRYVPARDGTPPRFRVETNLNGVTLAVGPEEWGAESLIRFRDLSQVAEKKTIALRQVSGMLIFTERGIEVNDLSGRVENNGVRVSGHYAGYGPTAPFKIRVSSLETENIYIPASPRYVQSLPRGVREFYNSLRPQGTARIDVELERPSEAGRPIASGSVEIVNGQFSFDHFPYPLREATGKIVFGPDRNNENETVHIIDVRGRGVEGGPNRDSYVTIEGSIGPLIPDTDPAVDVRVSGSGVCSEPALEQAFPPEVRQALRLLGANGPQYPSYFGDFVTRAHNPGGRGGHWTFDTDVALDDASGAVVGFPYALHHVRGNLKVRDGYVDVQHMQAQRGESSVDIDGRVAWGAGFDPDAPVDLSAMPGGRPIRTLLHLIARRVPLDGELIAAIPADKRGWITKLGVKGMLDVDGDLSQPPPVVKKKSSTPTTSPADAADFTDNPISFNLRLKLADGQMTPQGSTFSLSNVSAAMQLTPDELRIDYAAAHRGSATVGVAGDVSWPAGEPRISLQAQVMGLELDQDLHGLLPARAQAGWDALQPHGTVDVDLTYTGAPAPDAAQAPPSSASVAAETRPTSVSAAPATQPANVSIAPTTQPATANATLPTQPASAENIRLVLQPRVLSIKPVGLPYRFDAVKGAISINGDHLIISGLTARHGDAAFTLAGTGELVAQPSFDLQLTAKDVMIGPALRDAMPESVQTIIDGLKLHGPCNFRFAKLVYRAPQPPATQPSAAAPVLPAAASAGSALDFSLALSLRGGGLDVGVPLDDVDGTIRLDAQFRDGALTGIHGNIDADSFSMAGRTLHHFGAELIRSEDGSGLRLTKMEAELANGEMAGEVDIAFPNDGPSRYTLDLVVRNADVRELARETDPSIQGDLTASLSLEGAWGDLSSRRGRGDVLVTGKEMYRIPLILGLLQVTNLALPIAQPFHRGTARYSLDGQRVNFDQIELRSDTMLMTGTGHLDFGTKQVRMSFVTDNPGGIKVPILNDLLKGARDELLKINVKGTITQPKVETSVMGTFTTTVDEVLRGDSAK